MLNKVDDASGGSSPIAGVPAVKLESVSKWRGTVEHIEHRYVRNESLQSLIELTIATRFIKHYAEGRVGEKSLEPLLKEITVTIERGSVVGVIDIGGQYRQALIQILSNREAPSNGTVSFFGKIAALHQIGSPSFSHMTCRENLEFEARISGLRLGEIRAAMLRVPHFSGLGHLLDVPCRRVDKTVFPDLGLSLICCLDYDVLIADDISRPRSEKVASSWQEYLRRVPETSKTVILSSRDTQKLLGRCTHLLLLDQAKLLAYGRAETVETEWSTFISRACTTPARAFPQFDISTDDDDDDDA